MYADLYIVQDDGLGNLVAIETIPLLIWDSDATRQGPGDGPPGNLQGNYEEALETSIEPGVANAVEMDLLIDQAGRDLVNQYLSNGHPVTGFWVNFILDKTGGAVSLNEYEGGNLDNEGYTEERGHAGLEDNELWVPITILPDLGGGGGSGTGAGGGSPCVAVNTSGTWDMVFTPAGGAPFTFPGTLSQTSCDLVFTHPGAQPFVLTGPIAGNAWTATQGGANPAPNRVYTGTFTGNPATSLSGSFTSSVNANDHGTITLTRQTTGGGGGGGGGATFDANFSPSKIAQEWADPFGAFTIGLNADVNTKFTGEGASADTSITVPVKVFGQGINLLGFSAMGRVQPSSTSATTGDFDLTFKLLDVVVSHVPGSLGYTNERTEPVITKSFGKDKSFLGVTVTAAANVVFGYKANVAVQPLRLAVESGPYGSVGASASGGANAYVVSAAIEGSLALLEDTLVPKASCTLGSPSGGRVTGTLSLELVNVLKGPHGSIDLVVKYPGTSLKSFWGLITGQGPDEEKRVNIVKFDTFEKTDPLFNQTTSTTVLLLH